MVNKMKKLKVYGGSCCGNHREIVATRTKRKAMELFGISYSHFKDYYSETGNKNEIEIATSKPNIIFRTKDNSSREYFEDKK